MTVCIPKCSAAVLHKLASCALRAIGLQGCCDLCVVWGAAFGKFVSPGVALHGRAGGGPGGLGRRALGDATRTFRIPELADSHCSA